MLAHRRFNWYKYSQATVGRTLVVYDFDDTIAHGTSNFERLLNVGSDKPYKWLQSFIKDYYKYGDNLYIMTARYQKTFGDCKKKIINFLKEFGINFPESNIICSGFLPSSGGRKKDKFREMLDEKDIDTLIFIDDSQENKVSVGELKENYPQVDFIII